MSWERIPEMQKCIDAVSNALARSKVGCLTAVSSPLPFAHVQLTRGEYEGDHHKFKLVAEKYGEGQVNRRNLAEMYHKAVKKLNVRGNITPRNHLAITSQSPRSQIRPCSPPAGQATRLGPSTGGHHGQEEP